jgi:hypothetical protein
MALLLGLGITFLRLRGWYLPVLTEGLSAWLLGRLIARAGYRGGCLSLRRLHTIILVSSGLIVLGSLGFEYSLFQASQSETIGLGQYFSLRLERGLTFGNSHWNGPGLVISWILQGVVLYFFALYSLYYGVSRLALRTVPEPVIIFVAYCRQQGLSDEEVRSKLQDQGWAGSQADGALLAGYALFPDRPEKNSR